tara:strand:- start:116 stop:724 length:609 start_codon:yes stop_codon:yes gene_type:complete
MKDNKQYMKEYREKNKEKIAASKKEWYQKNKESVKERSRSRYCQKNEEIKEQMAVYREKNKDRQKARSADWYQENKVRVTEAIRKNEKERFANDPYFRLCKSIRSRLRNALSKGHGKKTGSTLELTGCSWEELRFHLESQFTEGMTWENYGLHGWHVDHIKPCIRFDLSLDTEQKACFHYSNLQPLWASDNLSKSDKYEETK